MKLQRCANGHFYDGDKYTTCPHCQEAGLPGFKDDETVTQPLNRVPNAVTSAGGAARPDGGFGGGMTMPANGYGGFGGTGETVPVNGYGSYGGAGETVPVNGYGSYGGGETVPVDGFDSSKTVSLTKSGSGIPSVADDEKTIGIYDNIFGGSSGNTRPPVYTGEQTQQTSPCVGWLVCIGGDHIGRDFRLFEGRNTIGRSESNGIALRGDTSVSKEPQAIIAYEPKNNKFFAVPGTSRSLAYVNGQVLLGTTELHKNDVIELGGARLMLIPCCDDKFSWNVVAQNKP